MKSKWISMAVAAVALGMMSSASMADTYVGTVVLTQGPYSSGYGGEFSGSATPNATIPGDVSTFDPGITAGTLNSKQSSLVGGSSSTFQTFCIQEGSNDVVYYPGNPYAGILTNSITAGPQTVKDATAVLFDQFSTGLLANYNYTNTGPGLSRQASAGALQAAIWVAEGDQRAFAGNAVKYAEADAGITGNPVAIVQADTWYDDAEAYVKNGVVPQDISILELYGPDPGNSSPHPAQAQLVRTADSPLTTTVFPVPLPASAGIGFSMLGGFGILSTIRKRLRQIPQIA